MDLMAAEPGLDPLEFRLRNALEDVAQAPLGEQWRTMRCKETLQATAKSAGWGTLKAPKVGRGIGLYDREPGAFGPSSATLSLNADASLTLMAGAADTGTDFLSFCNRLGLRSSSYPWSAYKSCRAISLPPPGRSGPGAAA